METHIYIPFVLAAEREHLRRMHDRQLSQQTRLLADNTQS